MKLPATLEAEYAVVEPVACCVNSVVEASPEPGDRLGVAGCGFMGLILVQILSHSPLGELYAVEPDSRRRQLAGEFGAETLESSEDLPEGLDIIYECAGVEGLLDTCAYKLRRGGTLAIFAWHHEARSLDTDTCTPRG